LAFKGVFMKTLVLASLVTAFYANASPSSGVYPVEIPIRKLLKCADFQSETKVELNWPQNGDSGEAVELAQILSKSFGKLFYASYRGNCQDFANLSDVMQGYLSYEQYDYTTYPVSRGGDEAPVTNSAATLTLRLGPDALSSPGPAQYFGGSVVKVENGNIEWTISNYDSDWSWIASAVKQRVQDKQGSVSLLPHFHVGDTAAVATSDGVYPVRILEISAAGSASIVFFSIYDQRQEIGVPLENLGYRVPAVALFKEGQQIRHFDTGVNRYFYAKIRELYSNSLALIEYEDGGQMWVDLKAFEAAER
jgi:hypothetical protein